MKKKVEMFTVQCDNCKEEYQDEHSGFCAWTDFGGAWEYASEENWTEHEGNHYCEKCHSFDDDDNLILEDSRTK
jgi:hypothetical protein